MAQNQTVTLPFSRLLRHYRRGAGLTQEELAERAGLSVRAIGNLERLDGHQPHRETVYLLAEALELTAEERTQLERAARATRTSPLVVVPAAARANAARPSGIRTFLIADIRGYTQFTVEHGDEAAARLAGVFAAIAKTVAAEHGGDLVELRGDEALIVFDSARRALHAALELQKRCAEHSATDPAVPVLVGIGLDAGEAVPVEGGYRGGALNLAARLCSIAGSGEVLSSETVVGLARKTDGIAFVDRGEVTLKGLPSAVRVIQVATEGELPADVPPLQPTQTPLPSSLPDEPTPLIGRDGELEAVVALFQQPTVRLVTLSGAGGTGKTRLAIRAARMLLPEYPDGVFLVSLSSLTNPALVPSAIASTLGIKEDGSVPLPEMLIAYLTERQMLLVLDNFEHLLEAGSIVESLLAACQSLRILVTSRAPLHLRREHEFAVPPLALPDLDLPPDLETLPRCEAVALFLDRARAVDIGFTLTPETAPAVAEICCRLDGLPLAIELAAAHVRTLSPQSLLEHLSSPLRVLVGGAQDMPARQRTLRSTIDWSYNLLSASEQALFARLSVFAGGCTLDDAEGVCNVDGDLDVLVGIQALVEKNLVRRLGESEPRFAMLETIRGYAAERLAGSPDHRRIRGAHARRYLRLTVEAGRHQRQLDRRDWWQRLDMEHDNFRDALAWLVSDGPAEEAGRLAEALAWYWMMGGYITEARHWLSLVNGLAEVSDAVRSRTLYQAASILLRVGELEVATGVFEEALTLARRLGDPDATVRILDWLGDTRQELGDFARAKECIDEALALARGRRSQQLIATVLHASALLALRQGDLGRAEDLVDEACMLWQELGEAIGLANSLRLAGITLADQEEYERATAALDRSLAILRQGAESWASSLALMWRGIVAEAQGDLEHAGEWYQEALDLEATGEDRRMRALASMRLAGFQCRLGDYEQARSLYATSVALMQTLGFLHPDLGDVVYGLAEYAAAVGRPAEAARLLGAAEVRLATLGIHLAPRQASWIAHIGAAIGEQLDTDAFEQALEEGRDTPLGELLDAALRLRPAHIGLHLAAENGDAGAVPSP